MWPGRDALLLQNHASGFLDDNLARHLRMHGTEIIVRARRARGDRKFLIGVQRRRFVELLIRARDDMRVVVAIDPCHFRAGLYGQGLRGKVETFDLDLILLFVFLFGQSDLDEAEKN